MREAERNKSNAGPTRDDWLRALGDAGLHAGTDDPTALTVPEFAKMMDLPRHTAARHLDKLEKVGKAIRTRKWAHASDGTRRSYLAFKLT